MYNPDGAKLEKLLALMAEAERDMIRYAAVEDWASVANASDRLDELIKERESFINSKGKSRDADINEMKVE